MSTGFGARYLLEEVIGQGAVGRVHRGVRVDTGASVAIKVHIAADPTVIVRFIQERDLVRAIVHPNVVRVHDMILDEGKLGIVMDYVAGGDLRRSTGFVVTAAHAMTLLAAVADGLAAVHAADFIHRDLKPENILIEQTPTGLVPRITDFGISRLIERRLTRVESLIGTLEYLAPEVATGGELTRAADVYSLGVILYERVAGRLPGPPSSDQNP